MRAQVDMKIVYLALSLVMLGIFIQVVWPMIQSAAIKANETGKEINETLYNP